MGGEVRVRGIAGVRVRKALVRRDSLGDALDIGACGEDVGDDRANDVSGGRGAFLGSQAACERVCRTALSDEDFGVDVETEVAGGRESCALPCIQDDVDRRRVVGQ